MTPILGRNAYIQFYKSGDYRDFACAESIAINFSGDEKSVKTVGDGPWRRTRLQTLGYTLSVDGLVPYDDESKVHAFDLLDCLINMTDIQFQMIFETQDGQTYKVIRGVAGVRGLGFTSPDDFVGSSIQLTGQGAPEITDISEVCVRTITGVSQTQQTDHTVYHISILNISGGQVPSYDYSLDGAAFLTSLGGNFDVTGVTIGSHTLQIWPVCDNGVRGDVYTLTINRIS